MPSEAPTLTLPASNRTLPTPVIPDFSPGPFGLARTPSGGIFMSVSGMKEFRECPTKFLITHALGMRKKIEETEFTLGGLYGAGVQAWLMTGQPGAVYAAIDAEMARRFPPENAEIINQVSESLSRISSLARRWVRRYMEVYPNPRAEFEALASEQAFCVPLPVGESGRQHFFVGYEDLPFTKQTRFGVSEFKTSSEQDKGKLHRQFLMNEQILGYTYASQKIFGMDAFGEILLDVCVKPRKIMWDSDTWEKEVRKEVNFWRESLMPLAGHVNLWAQHASVTADRIAGLLDLGEKIWNFAERNYEACFGAFKSKPCVAYNGCLTGNWGDLVQTTHRSPSRDPGVLLQGREVR